MLFRFPLLLLWNLIRNILRFPFVCVGWFFGLWSKPKSKYVRIAVHHGLLHWEDDSWIDWFRDDPSDLTLRQWKKLLKKLGKRKDVLGIIIDVHELQSGLTMINELTEWLADFKKQEKQIVLMLRHHMGVGEFSLCTVADKIILQPSATVHLTSPAMQGMFFAPLLKRFGVEMAMVRIGAHKNAPESMTRAFPSPTHREDLQSLLDSVYRELYAPLAEARNMSIDELYALFAQGFFSLEEALEMGLIDGVRYADRLDAYLQAETPEPFEYPEHPLAPHTKELIEAKKTKEQPEESSEATEAEETTEAKKTVVKEPKKKGKKKGKKEEKEDLCVDWGDLNLSGPVWWKWSPIRKKPMIGIIPIVGNIVDQKSRNPGSSDGAVRDQVLASIEEARTNTRIKSAIVYINSRGGSGYASEAIWRELRRLDEEKPVIAYLDDYAASGGYYIACGARKIISNPWCITGSIGVFGGKPVLTELVNRLQIGISGAGDTPGSRFFSPFHKPTEAETERLRAQLAMFYERFLLRVADNRQRRPDEIEPLAQGRVYLGTDALKCGLVDQCAGFDAAYQQAKDLGELQGDIPIQFLESSSRFSFISSMMGQAIISSMMGQAMLSARGQQVPEQILTDSISQMASLLGLSAGMVDEFQMLTTLMENGGIAAWLDSELLIK